MRSRWTVARTAQWWPSVGHSSFVFHSLNSEFSRDITAGECGLDYDRLEHCPRDVQLQYFRQQLELAHELDLPLFLHNRNTGGDFVNTLKEFEASKAAADAQNTPRLTGIVHSFDGPADELRELVDRGFYIGVNGCSMKTEENLQVIRDALPLERLVLETDAPWCELRPAHASWPLLQAYQQAHAHELETEADMGSWRTDALKKEKFQWGKRVKGRNEPCMIRCGFNNFRLLSSDFH